MHPKHHATLRKDAVSTSPISWLQVHPDPNTLNPNDLGRLKIPLVVAEAHYVAFVRGATCQGHPVFLATRPADYWTKGV